MSKPTGISERFFRAVRHCMNAVALLGLFFLAADPSFEFEPWYVFLKLASVYPILAVFILHVALGVTISPSFVDFVRNFWLDLMFFSPLFVVTVGGVHPAHILLVRQFIHYFDRYLEKSTISHLATAIAEKPARLISMSFAGVILTGAFLLVLPVSVAPAFKPSFLTALFTSTSAVCVTGLVVVDTGTYFTFFGQVVVLGLIQVGGLGIMTLSAGVAMLVGKKMAVTQRTVMQNVLDQTDLASLLGNLKEIIKWTFFIESIGGVVIGIRYCLIETQPFWKSMYFGFFHSISAFCNAGFGLLPDNLMKYVADPVVSITIMLLIVFGGLGFGVIGNVVGFILGRRRGPYDIHTVLVLVTTLVLIFGGAAVLFVLETDAPSMFGLSTGEKIMAAFFQSITTRTAGFNTIDIGIMKTSSLFFMAMLMFIGASPASTGGGIKTTTFATMVLTLDSQMREQPDVVVMNRTIPNDVVLKSFLITGISASLVGLYTFLLVLLEDQPLIKLLFEVTSAFGTVGLSANLTPSLCSLSKVLIISLMYIGRIGPLTLALSVRSANRMGNIHYPATRIFVG